MYRFPRFLILLALLASPAAAQDRTASTPLLEALSGALRGCEAWVLEPATWSEGSGPFLARIGLGDRVSEAETLPEQLMPPEALRQGNRFWRIAAGGNNGFALVVSQDISMCHITGGGAQDLQPAAEGAITAAGFAESWEPVSEERSAGIVSTLFRSRRDGAFTLLFSRADAPGARRDRAQVIATATYDLGR